jgi:membrane-associated phospholipid phosphatase
LGNVQRFSCAAEPILKTNTPVSTVKALSASVGLSLLFLIIYGGCIWVTSRRHDVGVFYFAWERAIPFVPFMILPYMSIDLFFVAAPFFISSERDLKAFVLRVASAIIAAGICFLAFPLRFAFPEGHADGWLGALFDWFRGMDAPCNLFPSLHAALMVFLLDVYVRSLRGIARIAVIIWFVLIGLSPLLTHQHHIIDIIGGFVLAATCFYVIQPKFPLALSDPRG